MGTRFLLETRGPLQAVRFNVREGTGIPSWLNEPGCPTKKTRPLTTCDRAGRESLRHVSDRGELASPPLASPSSR